MIEDHVLQLWAEHAPAEHKQHEPLKVVGVKHANHGSKHPSIYHIRCSCPRNPVVEIKWIELVEEGAA